MLVSNPTHRYGRTAVLLHWIIGVALLAQLSFGWILDEFERGSPARAAAVNLHKSTGLILAVFILWRILWRRRHPPPLYAANLRANQLRAIRAGHLSLYFCMVAMPLSGYLASNFSRHGIKFLNLVSLPPWGPDNKAIYGLLNGTHNGVAAVFSALVVGHILMAVYHAFIVRDGLTSRMSL